MGRSVFTFNGVDPAAVVPGLSVIATNPYRPPVREITENKIANSDISVTSAANYKDKKLNVAVEIGRNTRELLDDSIDLLLACLQEREAALVLSAGSTTRQWTATFSNMSFSDAQGGHVTIDIEFLAANGIGTDISSTSLFSNSLSGASNNTAFVGGPLGGSVKWQQPVITITLSALSGGTGASVVVGNPSNGQQVTITRNWTAGDVIVIDSRSGLKKVTVNGTEVAFTGSIPEWQRGLAGSMDYSDTLTTRTRAMSGLYYKRYL